MDPLVDSRSKCTPPANGTREKLTGSNCYKEAARSNAVKTAFKEREKWKSPTSECLYVENIIKRANCARIKMNKKAVFINIPIWESARA